MRKTINNTKVMFNSNSNENILSNCIYINIKEVLLQMFLLRKVISSEVS